MKYNRERYSRCAHSGKTCMLSWRTFAPLETLQHQPQSVRHNPIRCRLDSQSPRKLPLESTGKVILGKGIAPTVRSAQHRNVGCRKVERREEEDRLEAERWLAKVLGVDD